MWINKIQETKHQQNVLPLVFDFVAVTHIYLFIYSLLKNREINDGGKKKRVKDQERCI